MFSKFDSNLMKNNNQITINQSHQWWSLLDKTLCDEVYLTQPCVMKSTWHNLGWWSLLDTTLCDEVYLTQPCVMKSTWHNLVWWNLLDTTLCDEVYLTQPCVMNSTWHNLVWWSLLDTTLCDEVCQWLTGCQWSSGSPGTLDSSINKMIDGRRPPIRVTTIND